MWRSAIVGKSADVQRKQHRLDDLSVAHLLFRLITVRLITEIRRGELIVAMRGHGPRLRTPDVVDCFVRDESSRPPEFAHSAASSRVQMNAARS
jgi:hypothetical protein